MYDIALDKTGDWVFTGHRDIQGVFGNGLIEQRVWNRLIIPRGKWIYDEDKNLGSEIESMLRYDYNRILAEVPVLIREALEPMDDIEIINIDIALKEDVQPPVPVARIFYRPSVRPEEENNLDQATTEADVVQFELVSQ